MRRQPAFQQLLIGDATFSVGTCLHQWTKPPGRLNCRRCCRTGHLDKRGVAHLQPNLFLLPFQECSHDMFEQLVCQCAISRWYAEASFLNHSYDFQDFILNSFLYLSDSVVSATSSVAETSSLDSAFASLKNSAAVLLSHPKCMFRNAVYMIRW